MSKSPLDLDALFTELEAPQVSAEDKAKVDNAFALLLGAPLAEVKRGPKPINGVPMTPKEYKQRYHEKRKKIRIENIAVLDMETEPFNHLFPDVKILPFVAELYSPNFEPIIIWEEDYWLFVERVVQAIESLPEPYVIYAHNGGKFDFMFLLAGIRGQVKFKGRGIMSARIGQCELRDSYHIIPDRLASYKKDEFDYSKLRKQHRKNHRHEILSYLHSDCVYLHDIIVTFVTSHGFKYSIGQAAMTKLKQEYKTARLGEGLDAKLREYFYGGRTQCLAGKGHFTSDHRGRYTLFDINSQYPYVMACFNHPTGDSFEYRTFPGVQPTNSTFFLKLRCRNFGALVGRDDDGDITTDVERGEFLTSIYEYKAALELGLIDDVEILSCIDTVFYSDFSRHVLKIYNARQLTKQRLKELSEAGMKGTREYDDTIKDDMILKYLLNTGYGKFAQNPRRYKDYYLTDPQEAPPDEWFGEHNGEMFTIQPEHKNERYWIWQKPAPGRHFNNVATAASITGAARSVLMRAIAGAIDPIYCDTDSIIARGLTGVEIDHKKLGAWKIEQEFDEVIIAGKKLYACKVAGLKDCDAERIKVRSKGTQLHPSTGELRGMSDHMRERTNRDTWAKMTRLLDEQFGLDVTNKAPTLERSGSQHYIKRHITATAKPVVSNIVARKQMRA